MTKQSHKRRFVLARLLRCVRNDGLFARFLVISLVISTSARAAVLPEDRADVMYHSYNGGGIEITGPSVLVLKKVGQNVALSGNYYVDSISGASIDVLANASEYAEERTEVTGGVDYLHGNTTMSLSYTNSSENDYEANTAAFGISMDMFANMTTVSMGYAHGWNDVGRSDDATFSEENRQHKYMLGISQVLTKDMIMEVNYEGITDEGFLNNPYRPVRYLDAGSPSGISKQSEKYPRTRTSSALALRTKYYLPWKAAAMAEYRFFADTWGIDAHNFKIGYTHPVTAGWQLEARYRYYTQTSADFYSDLFPFISAQNFLARDKELSTFRNHSLGITIKRQLLPGGWQGIDRASINLAADLISFDYDDFRNELAVGATPGQEPFYSFDANVIQLYFSAWF